MQVRVKENVKWGDNFYLKGDILDMSSLADELYFEEVKNEKKIEDATKEEPKKRKKKLAK